MVVTCENIQSSFSHFITKYDEIYNNHDRYHLTDMQFELNEYLKTFSYLAKVAYLADIFTYFNELNLSLQGEAVNILIKKTKYMTL